MAQTDWGADPQVRYLRRVFADIEAAQAQLLEKVNVSSFDDRLRRWRDAALKLFEKTWILSARQGLSAGEGEISSMYLHCLAHYLRLNRVEVSQEALPASEAIDRLIMEALK